MKCRACYALLIAILTVVSRARPFMAQVVITYSIRLGLLSDPMQPYATLHNAFKGRLQWQITCAFY